MFVMRIGNLTEKQLLYLPIQCFQIVSIYRLIRQEKPYFSLVNLILSNWKCEINSNEISIG